MVKKLSIRFPTNFAQIHPTIETARYLMFYILRCHSYKPVVEEHFYPYITNWTTTQNSHVALRTRQVYALMQAEGKQGDAQLKRLIETLDEDANPVLQVMIFHSVDQVKK